MTRTFRTTPLLDGFAMPAEWSPHERTWMIWPERTDNWRLGAKPAQAAFLDVLAAIAQFEPVTLCASQQQFFHASAQAASLQADFPVNVVELSANDAWCRDTGPTFVRNDAGEVRGIDWTFNAWGGLEGGLYFPWDLDDQVAQKILSIVGAGRYRTDGFVLEGGSIHVDGEGTALTTEECLLNRNRNPHLDRGLIERVLREYLGVSRVLWLAEGIIDDETDGHIDNFACFFRPGGVLLAWTDDTHDPQYARCLAAWNYLSDCRDARGRQLEIVKLPLPAPLFATSEEFQTIDHSYHSQPRLPGTRLAASYVNFYLCNGGLIMPTFGVPEDAAAMAVLQSCFPDRRVVPVPGREILLGGGNVHCITQQQPAK